MACSRGLPWDRLRLGLLPATPSILCRRDDALGPVRFLFRSPRLDRLASALPPVAIAGIERASFVCPETNGLEIIEPVVQSA